mgnify:FL=1
MRTALLKRTDTGDQGTFGKLTLDSGFSCVSLELPWRNNAKGRSCVPPGTYIFKWRTDSPAHGECYEMEPDAEAPGRTNVQIHAANLAGDEDKGYVAQLLGCIAPGRAVVVFKAGTRPAGAKDQRGVTASKLALGELEADLKTEPFQLTILWGAPSSLS